MTVCGEKGLKCMKLSIIILIYSENYSQNIFAVYVRDFKKFALDKISLLGSKRVWLAGQSNKVTLVSFVRA